MAAVNCDGTKKVIDQSCHTVASTNGVIQKSYVVLEQQYPQFKKKTECYVLEILLQNFRWSTNIYWKQVISRWSQGLALSNSIKN